MSDKVNAWNWRTVGCKSALATAMATAMATDIITINFTLRSTRKCNYDGTTKIIKKKV